MPSAPAPASLLAFDGRTPPQRRGRLPALPCAVHTHTHPPARGTTAAGPSTTARRLTPCASGKALDAAAVGEQIPSPAETHTRVPRSSVKHPSVTETVPGAACPASPRRLALGDAAPRAPRPRFRSSVQAWPCEWRASEVSGRPRGGRGRGGTSRPPAGRAARSPAVRLPLRPVASALPASDALAAVFL